MGPIFTIHLVLRMARFVSDAHAPCIVESRSVAGVHITTPENLNATLPKPSCRRMDGTALPTSLAKTKEMPGAVDVLASSGLGHRLQRSKRQESSFLSDQRTIAIFASHNLQDTAVTAGDTKK